MSQPKKQYVIRKYIPARSAAEALRIEHKFKADEVWLADPQLEQEVKSEMGFKPNGKTSRRQTN